jgi:hypothetical protein
VWDGVWWCGTSAWRRHVCAVKGQGSGDDVLRGIKAKVERSSVLAEAETLRRRCGCG